MKYVFIFLTIPFLLHAQSEKLQPIGTVATYVISCPCKLFKYYEKGEMFYYCKDRKSNTDYKVKEFKHKDGLDILLNTINKNLLRKSDSTIINNNNNKLINEYASKNPKGFIINFLGGKAIIINEKNEKKIFFSDIDLLASYEITISNNNPDSLNFFFTKSINSLLPKRKNLKTIF